MSRKKSWSEKLFSNLSKNLWRPDKWEGGVQTRQYEITKVIRQARRVSESLGKGDYWVMDDYDQLVNMVSDLYNVMELDKLAKDNARRKKEVRALVDKAEKE